MPSASPPPPPVASPGDAERTLYEPVKRASGRIVGVLVGVEGSLEGELVAIHDGESTLGRGESCRVRLRSQRISREHAKVVHQDGIFVIQSLSERNPTKVNGESTEGSELKHGDSLTLGDATFRFLSVN